MKRRLPECSMNGWFHHGCRPSNSDRKCEHFKPGQIYCPRVQYTPADIDAAWDDMGPECCRCPECTAHWEAAVKGREEYSRWLDKKCWVGIHRITNRENLRLEENRKFFAGWTDEERNEYIDGMAEWARKNEEAREAEWKLKGWKK